MGEAFKLEGRMGTRNYDQQLRALLAFVCVLHMMSGH